MLIDDFNDAYDVGHEPSLKLSSIHELEAEFGRERVHVYVADICDERVMERIYERERYNRVIHLAARAGVQQSLRDPQQYARSNIQGTLVLLEIARRAQGAIQHFVYASSSSVYGDSAPIPFTEDDPTSTPVSPYAATKKSAELFAATYSSLYALPCTGLRFFTVFGPRGRSDMSPYIFIDRIARELPIPVYGDPSQIQRDFTYIDDIVQGVLKALDHVPGTYASAANSPPSSASPAVAAAADASLHQVFNIGRGQPILLSDLIRLIAAALTVEPILDQRAPLPGDVKRTFASTAKAERLLGYRPTVSVEEGMRRTVEWYKLSRNAAAATTSATVAAATESEAPLLARNHEAKTSTPAERPSPAPSPAVVALSSSKVTLLLTGFYLNRRLIWLRRTILTFLSEDYADLIDRIVLVWNNPDADCPLANITHPRLLVLPQSVNHLPARWTASYPQIRTAAVLNLDDDIVITRPAVLCMLSWWRAHPSRLITPFVRRITEETYVPDELMDGSAYSAALPRALMLSREHLVRYASKQYAPLRQYVIEQKKGDDILMNAVAMHHTRLPPLRVLLPAGSIIDYFDCHTQHSDVGGKALQQGWAGMRTTVAVHIGRNFTTNPFLPQTTQLAMCADQGNPTSISEEQRPIPNTAKQHNVGCT